MSRPLSYLEISREVLRQNVAALRSFLHPKTAFFAVVKGNAYGHGLQQVVEALDDVVDGFQVDDIEELRALRQFSSNRGLVLGYVQRSELAEAVSLNAELAIYDRDALAVLQGMEGSKVHLKIDALLGRQGVLPDQLPDFVRGWDPLGSPRLMGVYSHYSNLEDTPERSHANAQRDTFFSTIQTLEALGWKDIPRHFSSTAGILTFEGLEEPNCLVRGGIGTYGLYPSPGFSKSIHLSPALKWVSHLAQVKELPAGHPVGYGLTYVPWRPTRIGIVPQGYSDGYDRLLSNKGIVLVGGKRCKVLGRVAMNMIAIDLSEAPDAKAEDEVVLLGKQSEDVVTAEQLASTCETINYEIVTRISPLLPRFLV